MAPNQTASNALVTQNYKVPSTQIGSPGIFDELAKPSKKYIKSIKLYTKGKAIDMGLIPPGRWGIYESKDQITDLGTKIEVLIVARRPCAVDWTVKPAVRVYDDVDPNFIRIRELAANSSKHECGVGLLVFERSTGDYYDWYCQSASTLRAAKEAFGYMEVTEEMAKELQAQGKDVQPHGMLPCTLTAKFMDGGNFTYHAPLVSKCSAPFTNLPDEKTHLDTIARYLNPKSQTGEAVNEGDFDGQR